MTNVEAGCEGGDDQFREIEERIRVVGWEIVNQGWTDVKVGLMDEMKDKGVLI